MSKAPTPDPCKNAQVTHSAWQQSCAKESKRFRDNTPSNGSGSRLVAPYWQEGQDDIDGDRSHAALSRRVPSAPSLPSIEPATTPMLGYDEHSQVALPRLLDGAGKDRWSRSSHSQLSRGSSRPASRLSRSSSHSGLSRLPSRASNYSKFSVKTTESLRREIEAAVQEEVSRTVEPLRKRLAEERAARLAAEERLGRPR
mmetsp:Transcript_16137/g.34889  ORF Transcript_16137/g.34889 Transcript_16137/m.34889 type:complete len:199 (+) Transcript_16137:46-642(+)